MPDAPECESVEEARMDSQEELTSEPPYEEHAS